MNTLNMNMLKQTLAGYRDDPKSLVETIPKFLKLWALVQLFLRIFTCYDGELCAPFLFKIGLFFIGFALASGLIDFLWLLFQALLEFVWDTLKELPIISPLLNLAIRELGPKDISYFIARSANASVNYAKWGDKPEPFHSGLNWMKRQICATIYLVIHF